MNPRNSFSFADRHIGPSDLERKTMLSTLGFTAEKDFMEAVIPRHLISSYPFEQELGEGLSEQEALMRLKEFMKQNRVMRNLIGMGYHESWLPPVIQRNMLENPGWYTAYTPYQAEISQGRLESLINFQTMIVDLTGLDIANASLLDEGTACAEACAMALHVSKNKNHCIFLDQYLHPQVIAVVKTRMDALGVKVQVGDPLQMNLAEAPDALILAYPNTLGEIRDYRAVVQEAKKYHVTVIVDADLLALTLLTPPGEWGCDICVGSSQRFGVPLFNGGPHAAFLAAKDAFKRQMPGRIVGATRDKNNRVVYRLTLQTREQHIRREKATSNICTAQVLLANIAAMYAVYHGPQGLKQIALSIHHKTQALATELSKIGFKSHYQNFFDTLFIPTSNARGIWENALRRNINLRLFPEGIGIALNETTSWSDLYDVWLAFAENTSDFKKTNHDHVFKAYEAQSLSAPNTWPDVFIRKSPYLTHPNFNRYHSETKLMRYLKALEQKDITLTRSMIPLGSCTMKLNATSELMSLTWPEVANIHPFAPQDQTPGYQRLISDLEDKLCKITGYDRISFQPNSGAQGEYAGLLVIKKYLASIGQGHRHICLVPSSAHGTNPASAVMAGFKVIVVNCDQNGNIDLLDLKQKVDTHKDHLAALMITYPSTHGVFEDHVKEICDLIHQAGGQVYMDGANLNALVGWVRPAEIGADVSHMNLHKTFAIPHGGGGPGVGPIGVKKHLAPFLPQTDFSDLINSKDRSTVPMVVSAAPYGSAAILTISWMYITMMGGRGLKEATQQAILSANYVAKKLETDFPILYKGSKGLVAHECILDLRDFKPFGIEVADVAKRLMDFGFHAPTVSWPVPGSLMIEPTESESLDELDRFIEAMKQIRREIEMVKTGELPSADHPLKNAPHTLRDLLSGNWSHPYSRELAATPLPWVGENKYWPPVNRADESFGDRNVFCVCPPTNEWQEGASS